MKPVSNEFKQEIKKYGRQIDTIIKYTDNNGEHVLDSDVLYSVTPNVNGNILKSVMKQLDFESSVELEKGTIINAQFGLKINEEYEYINFGDYIVSKEPEYNADTQTYSYICYDKMLYSMKEYQRLNIVYPITIREYINALCSSIGLTFKNRTDTFANYDKEIKLDLYNGVGYTYRDILDELAEVTASTICINETTGELEIRYINDTQDTINEDYLNDINVEFGEKYGPINSIILSRAAESDNIFLRNETSVQLNGLCELKIIDNQIMNDNDRNIFLADILEKLDGTTYYINDFNSKGILWLDLCDKYTVQIGDSKYQCVLLNDEIKITQGLEESIYTEPPTSSETDYTKADETDRRINQTYIMVDKQNQKIESVISNVTEQNNKISQVTQTVDELNSKIGDIADITTSQETLNGTINFEGINQSEPIYVKIYPTGVNISYLYPHENLYPSETLFMTVRTLRFTNTTTNEYIDYELPTDLLYYDSENYDEFILDYDAQTCVVNKRVGYNADGTTHILENPSTIEYEYPRINLTDGDYTVELLGYHNAYMLVKLMAQNIYTTQFATKAEVNSEISQTAQEINIGVDKKLESYPTTTQMNAAINVKSNEITSTVSQTYTTKTENNNTLNASKGYTDTQVTTAKSEIKQTTDSITSEVSKKVGNNEIISKINQSAEAVGINANKIELSANDILNLLAGNTINLTSKNIILSSDCLVTDKYGRIILKDSESAGAALIITSKDNSQFNSSVRSFGAFFNGPNGYVGIDADFAMSGGSIRIAPNEYDWDNCTTIQNGEVDALTIIQRSLESKKKNIEEYKENALEIVKNSKIYAYHFKHEDDKEQKHIGFVIGDEGGEYKTPEQVIARNGQGVDAYTETSILWKAFQEQQEIIEQLQKEIKEMKGENKDGEN